MPGLIEANDGRLYVVKFRGAGQGPLAIVAEIVAGEIARELGLRVPEIVLMKVDASFGRAERDPEIRDLLRASTGLNAALAFLPEATTFDAAAGDSADPAFASLTVWFDAFVLNVDRTSRNANILWCRDALWLIDHGASLYFHHNWPSVHAKAAAKFEPIAEHILLPWATQIEAASAIAHASLTAPKLEAILHLVPDEWLVTDDGYTPADRRAAYLQFFTERLAGSAIFEQEVQRVRADRV